ncbi:MAG: protein kinase [Nannocystaceae bacterium]
MPEPSHSDPRLPVLPPELADMSADATIPAPSRVRPPSASSADPDASKEPRAPSKDSKSLKKTTHVMLGAPPPMPGLESRPKAPKVVPVAPPPDPDLPSHQETVIGPAPAPPVSVAATPAAPPAPAASVATVPPGEHLFDSLMFEDAPAAEPERTSDPRADRRGLHDTMPNPRGNLPTSPASGRGNAAADTVPRVATSPADEVPSSRPTTSVRSSDRSERAGTQIHGTEGLSAPAADAPKLRLIPGKVIPGTRFRIERWLGEGGMGVVYEVSHVNIDRPAALKILRFDLSQQTQMAQVFRDEARAASSLKSPYIVEVFDFGELSDGRLFFSMDLLTGTDLVPTDERTSMDPGRLIGILRQVCKGLAKAHGAGVVHRDIKPENIIVSTVEGREDRVKIVDFGISAMLAAGESRAGVAGTPHYMAPEQILGSDFDGRLDIYALGCTAYELLVGVPPFDAEEVEDILKLHLHEAPAPPSQRRPDLSVPERLEATIMRCLAKDPQDRYADMADLEAALCEAQIAAGLVTGWDDLNVPPLDDVQRYERIVEGMPSNLPPTAKRPWLWPVVAATSSVAALGLAAFLLFGGQPTDEDKDIVEQVTIEARDAASKSSWVIPPPNLDSEVTALLKVEELEDIEGSAEDLADERGEQLREEFASTLIGHGDALWDPAREISRQYYIWALMFDRDNEHALERANIDVITLDDFRVRALQGKFSEVDRLIAGVAALQVVEDVDEKAAISDAVQESMDDADALAPQTVASLERGASKAGLELPRARRGTGVTDSRDRAASPRTAPDRGGDDSDLMIEDDGDEADEPLVDPEEEASRRKRRQKVNAGLADGNAKGDPARSRELTSQADDKRRQGLRDAAKTLYSQAIAANPSNGNAHLGLAIVHFDQSAYFKSRKSASKAVKLLPRSGKAHKVLGDAFYRELKYHDALEAYERAKALGMNVDGRIADVERLLGK